MNNGKDGFNPKCALVLQAFKKNDYFLQGPVTYKWLQYPINTLSDF